MLVGCRLRLKWRIEKWTFRFVPQSYFMWRISAKFCVCSKGWMFCFNIQHFCSTFWFLGKATILRSKLVIVCFESRGSVIHILKIEFTFFQALISLQGKKLLYTTMSPKSSRWSTINITLMETELVIENWIGHGLFFKIECVFVMPTRLTMGDCGVHFELCTAILWY